MYAIRSYYVSVHDEAVAQKGVGHRDGLIQQAAGVVAQIQDNAFELMLGGVFLETAVQVRITSYNVCYTKLLRVISHRRKDAGKEGCNDCYRYNPAA